MPNHALINKAGETNGLADKRQGGRQQNYTKTNRLQARSNYKMCRANL